MDTAARLRVSYLVPIQLHQINRAGGNGTAGTAMAVPVFEGEKMALLGLERKASAQIREGLTCASCMAVISGS